MMPPDNRDTLPPGPDDLTINERIIRIENIVLELKGAINDSFANLYVKLDQLRTDIQMQAANNTIAQRAIRRHSERLRDIETDIDKISANGEPNESGR